MSIGIIQWFDKEKGFGVIKTIEGSEYFLHVRQLRSRTELSMGMAVIFEKVADVTKKRDIAVNCRLMDREEDWPLLVELIGQADTVVIERKTRQKGPGGTYTQIERKPYSLITRGTVQLFHRKEMQWVKKLILRAFDDHLDYQYFIPFCEVLEKALPVSLGIEDAKTLLAAVFHYFGARLDPTLLFYTWRSQRFRYIGKGDADYEIPEQVLLPFVGELTSLEWKRIQSYSFAPAFNLLLFETQLERLAAIGADRLRDLYGLLPFLPPVEVEGKRQILVAHSVSLYQAELNLTLEQVPTIETDAHGQVYEKIKEKIGPEIGQAERERLLGEIDSVISRIASPSYRVQLWAKQAPIDLPFETIYAVFLAEVTDTSLRSAILGRLTDPQQLEALVLYRGKYGTVKAMSVLESYLKTINKGSYFSFLNNYFSSDFWSGKPGEALLSGFRASIQETATDDEKYALFFEGLYPELPMSVAVEYVSTWTKANFVYLAEKLGEQKDLLFELLRQKIRLADKSELNWLCDYAQEALSDVQKKLIDGELFQRLPGDDYFPLWRSGRVGIIPEAYILGFLERHSDVYRELKNWIADRILSRDDLFRTLITFLGQNRPISTFADFCRHWFILKFLMEGDQSLMAEVVALQQPFYALILWALDYSEALDFNFLAAKFIYFNAGDQARVLRKLFYLKASGKLHFKADDLSRFVRVDADLYKLAQDTDVSGQLDISSAIILEALVNFAAKRKFLVEGELIAIAIRHLGGDKKRKFTIGELLEKCLGRMLARQDFNTQGTIVRVPFTGSDGQMTFYYALTINLYIIGRVFRNGYWQDAQVYNENFKDLVEEVKKIPGGRWNAEKKHWGIPRQFETEAIHFAQRNRFMVDFGGEKSKENLHLVQLDRAAIPDGITFCEGRVANKPDGRFDRTFWWCEGRPCFQHCETVHSNAEWEKYTLLDFCRILEFDLSEMTRTKDVLETGLYNQFTAQMNRFIRLLDKMYCADCGEILYPTGTSNFAAHNVVRFFCTNYRCAQYQVEIYLNQCMNGKCNNVIDSRISKQCPHGLRICDECGSCCSHAMLTRRLQNLQATGGYIHPDLVKNVQEETGHLDLSEYYCYKDGNRMKETAKEVFECACGVIYDTRKYKFVRRPRPGQSPVKDQ